MAPRSDRSRGSGEETAPLLGRDGSSGDLSSTEREYGAVDGNDSSQTNGSHKGLKQPDANAVLDQGPVDTAAAAAPITTDHEAATDTGPFLIPISRARFRVVFGGVMLQVFVTCFDSTLMASSHPVITSYFQASNAASWLSTTFLLSSVTFQPLYGRISDTVGRKPIYLISLVIFAASTAWCALAPSMISLIIARAFAGLGAAGIFSQGIIMVNDIVPLEVRGTYQAYLNLFFGMGGICGASFGGYLCEAIGWRLTFGAQVPPIALIFVMAFFVIPNDLGPNLLKNSDATAWELLKQFDLLGSFTLAILLASLILGLNLGGNILPWSHPLVIACLVIAFTASISFVLVERRAYRPVIPLNILFTAPRGNIVIANFLAMVGINTVLFNAPLYFQAVKLDSPTMAGFRLAGPSITLTVCGVASGFLITATGRMKGLHVIGAVAMLIGGVTLTALSSSTPTWLASLFLVPACIGQGAMFPASSVAVLATSTHADQAVVTSTLTLMRNVGIVVGVAISSLVLQNALRVALLATFTGPDGAEIIEKIRKSVRAIRYLDAVNQDKAIEAYTTALRFTFATAIVAFVIANILIWPIKLPRLGKRGRAASVSSSSS